VNGKVNSKHEVKLENLDNGEFYHFFYSQNTERKL
jgi:hypothetical protein